MLNKYSVGQISFPSLAPLDPIPRLVVKTSFRSGIGRLVSGRNLVIIWSYQAGPSTTTPTSSSSGGTTTTVIWLYRPPPISNRSSPVLSTITSYWKRVTTRRGEAKPSEGDLMAGSGRWTGEGLLDGGQLKSSPN